MKDTYKGHAYYVAIFSDGIKYQDMHNIKNPPVSARIINKPSEKNYVLLSWEMKNGERYLTKVWRSYLIPIPRDQKTMDIQIVI